MKRAVLSVFLVGALIAGISGANANGRSQRDVPANDRARGVVFDDLARGKAGTPCEGLFEVVSDAPGIACTHGPDPAPAGVDVSRSADPASSEDVANATPIVCEDGDDGTSGYRVKMIYAYETDSANRYATYAASFLTWAGNVESAVQDSSLKTGGNLHVRWEHDGLCNLDIDVVALDPGALDTIGTMRTALRNAGYTSVQRKYHVWADSTVYCGVGYIYGDDSASQSNLNNGTYAMYSRTDAGCWGRTNSVEAHEIMHNLGGVQTSAPNATGGYHCVDNADRMCYNDGSLGGKTMLSICGSTHERLFDCGDNDYFNAGTPTGYLATHWNTATSRFLFSGDGGPPPPPPPPPPPTTTTDNFSSSLNKRNPVRTHSGTTGAGEITFVLTVPTSETANAKGGKGKGGGNGGGTPAEWTLQVSGPGFSVTETSATSISITTSATGSGSYTATVSNSANKGSYTLDVTHFTA